MEKVQIIQTVLSIAASILSILMFFLSWRQKKGCSKIKKETEDIINSYNKSYTIKSNDKINVNKVGTFDNRKTMK